MVTSRLISEIALVRGDLFGANLNAVLREAALLHATIPGEGPQAFFFEDFPCGVIVEQLDLGDGSGADEARVLIELRANLHAASARNAVRQRIVRFLVLREDARA